MFPYVVPGSALCPEDRIGPQNLVEAMFDHLEDGDVVRVTIETLDIKIPGKIVWTYPGVFSLVTDEIFEAIERNRIEVMVLEKADMERDAVLAEEERQEKNS